MRNHCLRSDLVDRISKNGARGKAARRHLRQNMSALPIIEIAKLPRSTLKRIGREPIGVAKPTALDNKKAEGRSTVALSVPDKKARQPTSLLMAISKLVLCVGLVVGLATAFERPARAFLYHTGLFTAVQMGLCLRLDETTDGCRFEVTTDSLPLERIAALVRISAEELAAKNPDLSRTAPLPTGTRVRIERNEK